MLVDVFGCDTKTPGSIIGVGEPMMVDKDKDFLPVVGGELVRFRPTSFWHHTPITNFFEIFIVSSILNPQSW